MNFDNQKSLQFYNDDGIQSISTDSLFDSFNIVKYYSTINAYLNDLITELLIPCIQMVKDKTSISEVLNLFNSKFNDYMIEKFASSIVGYDSENNQITSSSICLGILHSLNNHINNIEQKTKEVNLDENKNIILFLNFISRSIKNKCNLYLHKIHKLKHINESNLKIEAVKKLNLLNKENFYKLDDQKNIILKNLTTVHYRPKDIFAPLSNNHYNSYCCNKKNCNNDFKIKENKLIDNKLINKNNNICKIYNKNIKCNLNKNNIYSKTLLFKNEKDKIDNNMKEILKNISYGDVKINEYKNSEKFNFNENDYEKNDSKNDNNPKNKNIFKKFIKFFKIKTNKNKNEKNKLLDDSNKNYSFNEEKNNIKNKENNIKNKEKNNFNKFDNDLLNDNNLFINNNLTKNNYTNNNHNNKYINDKFIDNNLKSQPLNQQKFIPYCNENINLRYNFNFLKKNDENKLKNDINRLNEQFRIILYDNNNSFI